MAEIHDIAVVGGGIGWRVAFAFSRWRPVCHLTRTGGGGWLSFYGPIGGGVYPSLSL